MAPRRHNSEKRRSFDIIKGPCWLQLLLKGARKARVGGLKGSRVSRGRLSQDRPLLIVIMTFVLSFVPFSYAVLIKVVLHSDNSTSGPAGMNMVP